MRFRDGDVLEVEGALFNVVGLVHPPRKIISSIHYLPDPKGDRKRAGITYRKISSFSERNALLEEKFSRYLTFDQVFNERLCELPLKAIRNNYKPTNRLRELRRESKLDEVETQALSFIELLRESAGVRWGDFGIGGSILVKLHTLVSDLDPIVYGSKNCHKVYSALKTLRGKGSVSPHALGDLKKLFDFRSKDTTMSFDDFVRTESRKILQGKFLGRGYFIRCLKRWDEIGEKYGTFRYIPQGYAKIEAKISDDSEAIFTPCCYKITDVRVIEGTGVDQIGEVASFRGRFCDQAKKGEEVVAQGKVELVRGKRKEYRRLLVGNQISDFIVLK